MALPEVITPDMIANDSLPDVITPDMIVDESPSVTDRVLSIGKNAALNTVLAGTNLARAGNSAIEGAVNKLSDWFPDTTQGVYNRLPNWLKDLSTGNYAPPTDAEYASAAKDLRSSISDTTKENMPESGVGRYAYIAGQGLADLAPKMTMGPAGFAASSGAEGGLERFYSRTDTGTPSSEALPYALAGGAVDAATGYMMPKAIDSVLKSGAPTIKKLASELATFAGFGLSQTAIESVLKRYLAGDQNALDNVPQELADAIISAPFMMAGLKVGGLGVGAIKEKLSRTKDSASELEARMKELQTNEQATSAPSEPLALPAPDWVKPGVVYGEAPSNWPPKVTPRPEASSEAFVSSDGTPLPPTREAGRAGSKSFEIQDASPEAQTLQATIDKHNADVARYEMTKRDQQMADTARAEQKTSLPEATLLGDTSSPAPSNIVIPESSGGGPRTLSDAYQMLQDLKGGTEIYNTKRGYLPKAPEEPVLNPTVDAAKTLLERPKTPRGNGERGAFINPLGEAVDAVKSFIDRIGSDKEASRVVEDGIKNGAIVDSDSALPPLEKMFRGDKVTSKPGEQRSAVARKAIGAFNYYTTFVRTAANKSKEVRRWYDATKEELKVNHMTENDLFSTLKPYTDLANDSRVNTFLLLQRREAALGKAVKETDANLTKLGFSPEEISAIRAVRTTMDSALNAYREARLAEGLSPEEVDAKVKELKASHYVPFGRYGDWKVEATKGVDRAVHFEDSKDLALKRAAELMKQGYTSTINERVEAKDLPFKLPTELSEPAGFKKHLIPAKLTKGESDNLKRSIGDYIVNLARFKGYHLTAGERASTFKELKDTNQMKTYEWLAKVNSDFHSPTHGVVKAIRNGMYFNYLRLNPSSALVNMTQPATVTYPVLSKYVKWPLAKVASAYRDVGRYITSGKTSDAEVNAIIERAKTEGLLGDTVNKDWLEKARTGKGPSLLSKLVPDMFSKAEYANRLHSLIVGAKAFRERGLTGEELYKKATDFVEETQFEYGKINSPMMARGGMAAPFTFRLWLGNYLSLLGRSMNKQDYGVALRMLAAMGLVAGPAGGFPFVKELISGLESQGFDPRQAMKDKLGKSVDAFLNYGMFSAIPEEYRPNISGKVGVGEMVQDVDKGNLLATVGRAALGATADPILRTQKAVKHAIDGNYGRAVETMLPEGIPKSISKSIRIREKDPVTGKEKGFRTPDGDPIITDVNGKPVDLTGAEKVYTALGFQPTRLSEAYKRQHSMQLVTDRRSKLGAEINSTLADALYNKDWTAVRSVLQKAKHEGINVNSPSVKERIFQKLTGRELTQIKNAPKDIKDDLMRIYVNR